MLKCEICSKEFKSKKGFQNHIVTQHHVSLQEYTKKYLDINPQENVLICRICGYECSSTNGLGQHIKRKHYITSKEYYNKYLKKNQNEGKCIICGKSTKFTPWVGYANYCSNKCKGKDPNIYEKRKQTNINRYGTEYFSQSDIFKEKYKQTCLEKYGTEKYFQSNDFKNKRVKALNNRTTAEKQRSKQIREINFFE